jgi:hypothetical protein
VSTMGAHIPNGELKLLLALGHNGQPEDASEAYVLVEELLTARFPAYVHRGSWVGREDQ